MRRLAPVALAIGLVLGCESTPAPDAATPIDAQGLDARGLDAQGLDAQGLDAQGLDAQGLDALDLDAPGLDAPGLDAPGLDAPGLDAPDLDAPGLDAPDLDAVSIDAALDAGSPFDRCMAGCDHIAACGFSCSAFAIDCATVPSDRLCIVECLRGYDCSALSGAGLSECSTRCAEPRDAAYPDVFALDTRADSGTVTDRCTAGCDYLLGCGFSACTSLGIDCAMASEEQACMADCLRGFTCVDVPGPGYSYCLGACPSTRDAGPLGDAGPSPLACQSCAMASCGDVLSPCLADSSCQPLALCLANCSDTACRDDCLARHPTSPALRDPLESCLCARCAAPCAAIDPCTL
jgi:hypothetical protein